MAEASKRPALTPMTVRFPQEVMAAIEYEARGSCFSKAQIIRMAVDGNLMEHLRSIRYIPEYQSQEILKLVDGLHDATWKTYIEFHRMGVNLNQIAYRVNAFARTGQPLPEEAKLAAVTAGELYAVLDRYMKASGEVGAELCRILG